MPMLCRVLRVSKSGYYAWKKRGPSKHALEDPRLGVLVVAAHQAGRGRYGSPRVLRELRERGERISRKCEARLLRERGLSGQSKRKWRHPSRGATNASTLPNILAANSPSLPRIECGSATSRTSGPGKAGYTFPSSSTSRRRVVGWSMTSHMRTDIVLDALTMAVGQRLPGTGLLSHSDRGSQYTSDGYKVALRGHGIDCSMSRKGNCWDNAVVESLFGTLKNELLYRRSWASGTCQRI